MPIGNERKRMKNKLKDRTPAKLISRFSRRLHRAGLLGTMTGSFSILRDGLVHITLPGSDLLQAETAAFSLATGLPENPDFPVVPEELPLHLAVYRACPDAGAVIHGEPPTANAFAVAHLEMRTDFSVEAKRKLGENVPILRYLTPSSRSMQKAILSLAPTVSCILLTNRGALCFGKTPAEAADRIELLEATAKLNLLLSGFPGNELHSIPGKRKKSSPCCCGGGGDPDEDDEEKRDHQHGHKH